MRVEPPLVVDLAADTARCHGRWLHVTTFIRSRPDLDPADILLAVVTGHLNNGRRL